MNISKKIFLYFIILFFQVILLTICFLVILYNEDQLTDTQVRRFKSHLLSEELRQSSDDLTRMIRTYTVTGDVRYQKYFKIISAIRDGKEPRPDGYNNIFWDYITANHEYKRSDGQAVSIIELMKELQFTEEEFYLLAEAKILSDNLINMEIQALNAMNGDFLGADGQYSKHGKVNQEMARQIVHGERYHQLKAEIMSKMGEFFNTMNLRTENEIIAREATQKKALIVAISLIILMIISTILGYFYFVKDIVFPLRDIRLRVKQMKKGHYKFADTIRKDEIGLLLNDFVHMAKLISGMVDNLESIARTDQLTNINNRIAIDEILEKEKYKSDRYHTPCSIIMIDIDYFKEVNDKFGHIVGDKVLVEMANIFKKNMRKSDTIGRWGGEEFIAICPNTNIEQVKIVAEGIRKEICSYQFQAVQHLTASFGVSAFKEGNDLVVTLEQADKALYKAKKSGRNRVC